MRCRERIVGADGVCLTDVYPRGRRRRFGRAAHEECRLGGLDEYIAMAVYGCADGGLLVENKKGEDDVYGEGETACLSSLTNDIGA